MSIAEYLDQNVQVTTDKYNIYKCYDEYVVDRLNNDALDIVQSKRSSETSYGFSKCNNNDSSKAYSKIKKVKSNFFKFDEPDLSQCKSTSDYPHICNIV